jgi:hypothetical protein
MMVGRELVCNVIISSCKGDKKHGLVEVVRKMNYREWVLPVIYEGEFVRVSVCMCVCMYVCVCLFLREVYDGECYHVTCLYSCVYVQFYLCEHVCLCVYVCVYTCGIACV